MPLVCGVDSSTQSVKVVIRDAESGQLKRQGRAAHPEGTEVHPRHWWDALQRAIADAGGIEDVSAISIAGQQHGMVVLDANGEVIRDALLWNDTRSAAAALMLTKEFGGSSEVIERVGFDLVASITITKLRWLTDFEPDNARKVRAVMLPHDWLSWKLSESDNMNDAFTDRSDASGTGYFDSRSNTYRIDMLNQAMRIDAASCDGRPPIILPRVLSPNEHGGTTKGGTKIAAGMGDNAAAALGLFCRAGDVIVSLGTSGTVFASCDEYPYYNGNYSSNMCTTSDDTAVAHDSGDLENSCATAIFASATGHFLPLLCTLNAAQILDSAASLLNVSHEELSSLALSANPGADGVTVLPYFNGERTPNRPNSKGVFAGITVANCQRKNFARAMIEGMLCNLVDAVKTLSLHKGISVDRIVLIGGAAKNKAVQVIASALFNREVFVPPPSEYVADGAAVQAAWSILGKIPDWSQLSCPSGGENGNGIGTDRPMEIEVVRSTPTPEVVETYRALRNRTESW